MLTIHEYLANDHARLDALLARATASPDRIDVPQLRDELVRWRRNEQGRDGGVVRMERAEERRHRITLGSREREENLLFHRDVTEQPGAKLVVRHVVLDEHNPLEDAPDGLYDHCDRTAGDTALQLLAQMQAILPIRVAQHVDEPRIYEHIERMLAARTRGP